MTEDDFAYLRRFLRKRSGLALGADKRYLAESRLQPVWRGVGLESLAGLLRELRLRETGPLGRAVVDAMTTNETTFFRDAAMFDGLRRTVLPRLVEARAGMRRLRIWSAAASTGQEAYSVAMLLGEMSPRLVGWQVTILGTDVSAGAVERAKAGLYSQFEVQRGLPILSLLRHFTQGPAGWTISGEMRRAVEFRVFNLLDDFTPLGGFDLILCRNLLIYFDVPAKSALLDRLAAALAPDGALCLGASESIVGLSRSVTPDPNARSFAIRGSAEAPMRVRVTG